MNVVWPARMTAGAPWVPPVLVACAESDTAALAARLHGTCDPLAKHTTEAQRADWYFIWRLNVHARQCSNCGWWTKPADLNADDECVMCYY